MALSSTELGPIIATDFESILKDQMQFDLTHRLLGHTSFHPQFTLLLKGFTVFLSPVIKNSTDKADKTAEDNRVQALGYVVKEDSTLVLPRVFWRSITSGGWRVAPYGNGSTYSKGFGKHYTQETKVVEELHDSFEAIEQQDCVVQHQGDVIFDFFYYNGSLRNQHPTTRPPWLTYSDETTVFNEHGVLYPLTHFKPGSYYAEEWDKGINISSWLSQVDYDKPEIKGFIPDFTKPPHKTRTSRHTLLGGITLEEFPAIFFNRPVRWVVAQDVEGRTWIDRIAFTDVPINSYGICSEILDSGALTNKPLERLKNVTALREGDEYIPYGEKYADITPFIAKLFPIKSYKNLHP